MNMEINVDDIPGFLSGAVQHKIYTVVSVIFF